MCGIIGLLAYGDLDKKAEKVRQEAMLYLTTELLTLTEERGKDASGISVLFGDGEYIGQKMGVPASELVSRFGTTGEYFSGLLNMIRDYKNPAKIIIGHCRKSSVGDSINNANNHPIRIGDIIGVHNGTLKNHFTIFQKLGGKRDGQVDSEAIFRLLSHFTDEGTQPFTPEVLQEVVKRLEGTFAVLAMNGNNPFQLAAFRDNKPIELYLIKPLKLLVIVSEKKFMEAALCNFNRIVNLFGNPHKFPHLTKTDVDYLSLADDHSAIFNITLEVEEKTIVRDLVDITHISRVDKTWTSTATTTTSAAGKTTPHTTNQTNPTNVTNPVIILPETTTDVEKSKKIGRVWTADLKKYKHITVDELKKHLDKGNIELDVVTHVAVSAELPEEDGQVLDLDELVNASTFAIPLVDDIETVSNASAKIVHVPYTDEKKRATIISLPDRSSTKKPVESGVQTVEIDMTVDADALEAANSAIKELTYFESDVDLMTQLNIADDKALKVMQVQAVCNKVRKNAFTEFFSLGYKACKIKLTNSALMSIASKDEEKKTQAETAIRILKSMLIMLTKVGRYPTLTAEYDNAIEKGVVELFEKKVGISTKIFESLFREGDLRENMVLRSLKRKIAEKEARNG
jgi:amidophosphoribosyltransferase